MRSVIAIAIKRVRPTIFSLRERRSVIERKHWCGRLLSTVLATQSNFDACTHSPGAIPPMIEDVTVMQKKFAALGLLCTALTSTAFAVEGPVPSGVPHLDHVFLIMMENHGFSQVIDNPSAPYINYLAQTDNLATNYYAIAHPSLNNYLEIVGGSNFGVQSDNGPDWHNFYCVNNLASKTVNTDNPPSPLVADFQGWVQMLLFRQST